jgi:predicted RNase H-like HicB family nuclease
MRIIPIFGVVKWEAHRDAKSGQWVGICDELNLTTGGDTWAELQAMAQDAMRVLFQELAETGELEAVLKQTGLKLGEPLPADEQYVLDVAAPISVTNANVAA